MNLPQELLDEILSYLPPGDGQDKQLLQNCSLVAKSWVNPSRRQLFKTVKIRERDLQSRLDSVPPANNGLLHHVCSLSYVAEIRAWRSILPPGHPIDVLRDYLPFFQRLQHLSLSSVHLPSDISHQVEVFSAFQHTLSRLSLDHCSVTINALVAFINYFSSLDCLDLIHPLYNTDGVPAVPLSRPLISKLHISNYFKDDFDPLDQLWGLGLSFDEIVVYYTSWLHSSTLSRIVDALGVNAKYLRLLPYLGEYMCITRESTVRLAKSETMLLQAVRYVAVLQHCFIIVKSSGNLKYVRYIWGPRKRTPFLPSLPPISKRSHWCIDLHPGISHSGTLTGTFLMVPCVDWSTNQSTNGSWKWTFDSRTRQPCGRVWRPER